MAIFIDELMKDREMIGYYLVALTISATSEKLTPEKALEIYDTVFGENEAEEVAMVIETSKKQTQYVKDMLEFMRNHTDILSEQ